MNIPGDHWITLAKVCPFCGDLNYVRVKESDLSRYNGGTHTQDAFPYLNADERELVQTGICTPCWDKTFPKEDE